VIQVHLCFLSDTTCGEVKANLDKMSGEEYMRGDLRTNLAVVDFDILESPTWK
jgi:hypothetical protein